MGEYCKPQLMLFELQSSDIIAVSGVEEPNVLPPDGSGSLDSGGGYHDGWANPDNGDKGI